MIGEVVYGHSCLVRTGGVKLDHKWKVIDFLLKYLVLFENITKISTILVFFLLSFLSPLDVYKSLGII